MSPKSAVAFCRRASVGLGLLVLAWSGETHAAEDDLALDLGATSLDLRRIPKGSFTQGSPASEAVREADESPRNVTISRAFWLGKVPVTRAQFSRFVTETRYVTDAEKGQIGGFGWDGRGLVQKKDFTWRNPGFTQKDDDPVVLVSFGDANAFAGWASRKSGRRVRLPTEAEWEYASRAGTTTAWAGASRDDEALTVGWFKSNATYSTHPVAHKRPNAFGLFDMSGNVYEWCRDVYAPYPRGDATDPESTSGGSEPEKRVLRGGSWLRDPKRGRSASRHRAVPGTRNAEVGFRVAMDDDAPIAPAAIPVNDFAPASPVGMSSASSPSAPDASAEAAPASIAPPRSTEGGGWSLVIAPLAAAGFAVAWVLVRRRERAPADAPVVRSVPARETVEDAPHAPQPSSMTGPVAPPLQRESHRPAAVAVVAPDERPSSPALASLSAIPTGSPFTSEPSIVAAPATFSEALIVRASVVEAGLFEGSIVDVPLTPVVDDPSEPKEEAEELEAPREPPAIATPANDERPKDPSLEEAAKEALAKLEQASSGELPPAPPSSELPPEEATSTSDDAERKPDES